MAKPVAKLVLDTRSYGPIYCETCDDDLEDVLLMDDASVVCPECKGDIQAFNEFSDHLTSVRPVGGNKGKSKRSRWAIEWESPDTSVEGITTYEDMQEALEAAADWIKNEAGGDLENSRLRKEADSDDDPWTEQDEERTDLLKSILNHIKSGALADAIGEWLDYQDDVDRQDRMSIGPSGSVTDRSSDFHTSVDSE